MNKLVLLALATSAFSTVAMASPQCAKPVTTILINDLSCKAVGCQNNTSAQSPVNGLAQLAQMASNHLFPGAEKPSSVTPSGNRLFLKFRIVKRSRP